MLDVQINEPFIAYSFYEILEENGILGYLFKDVVLTKDLSDNLVVGMKFKECELFSDIMSFKNDSGEIVETIKIISD